MNSKEAIISFVRETLGCQCPQEVFEHIDIAHNPERDIKLRINVGGRLLIYVEEIEDPDSPDDTLEKLIRAGIEERDSTGLNRFRLVVPVEDLKSIKDTLMEKFDAIRRGDEKAHLHVLEKDDPRLKNLLA